MSSSDINSESHGSSKRTLATLLVALLVAGVIFPLASASETPTQPSQIGDMNCLIPRTVPDEPEITQGAPDGSILINPGQQLLTPDPYARDEVVPITAATPVAPSPCGIPPQPKPQAVLWDNGPLVNEPGNGAGGADASSLQTGLGMNTYGFGAQFVHGYHIADDFDVTDNWNINTIMFYSYQTGSTTTSTITGVFVQIWDGAPDGGGAVIWGDHTTNLLTATSWSNIYRVLDTDLLATNRPLMEVHADTSGLSLTPGTYWVDVMVDGSLASGPWVPPITIDTQTTTGNAMQWTGAWAPMLDSGTGTQQGIPFIIDGDVPGGGGGLDDILMYCDDAFHWAPNTYVDQALNDLGLPYTAHYDGDFAGFEADLTGGGPWDLVIWSGENYNPPDSCFDAMNTYATGGGNLICCDWDIADRPAHPLWTTMGFTYQGEYNPPNPVYWWQPGHQVFNNPESVPEFTSVFDPGYGTNGHWVEPLPGFDAVAGYTTPGPDPNQAALIWGNGGQTIYKSWLDGGNDADLDTDGQPDARELWINMIQSFAPPTGGIVVNNVAIFQTANPWGYPACQEVFDLHGISYDILGPADIGVVSLAPYQQIVIQGCDGQDGALYTAISANKPWFENFAASGKYVNIQGADWGAFNDMPFGVVPGPYDPADDVYIAAPGHPIVTSPNVIAPGELDGWNFAYHRYFTAWPPGAQAVVREDITGNDWPVCLDFPWGAGHVRVTGQTTEWAWGHGYSPYLENLLIYGTGGLTLDPAAQTRFGWTGDYVDHYITIHNGGPTEEVYTVMFGDFQWPVTFYNLDYYGNKNEQTWWVGPAPPGGEVTFIAEHRIPRVDLGDSDTVQITVQSVNDPPTLGTAQITTTTSLPVPYTNGFETGVMGQGITDVDWIGTPPDHTGVNDWTSYSGTHSMYLQGGPCDITSALFYLDELPLGLFSCAIQRGDDGFSENPDAGEDLIVEYADRGGRWHQLGTFPGDGPPGEVFYPLYVLPPEALHPKFQARFRLLECDEPNGDYWHIDDVYIGPPASAMDMNPDAQTGEALPGYSVDYDISITNNAPHSDIFDLSVDGNAWPTQILDSGTGVPIDDLGPIFPGDTEQFTLRVQVVNDAPYLDTDTANVGAWSQLDPLTGEVVTATTTAAEPDPTITPPSATMGGWSGSLVQYPFTIRNDAPSPDSFTVDVSGNSWPTTAYLPLFQDDFDHGTMNDWTPYGGNWWNDGDEIRQTSNAHAWDGPVWTGTYLLYDEGDTWNDYIYKVDVQPIDNDAIGLMFRYDDQDNYYRFRWTWEHDIGMQPGTQKRVLDKTVNGVWTELAWDGVQHSPGTWYELEVKCIGDWVQVYVDGGLVFNVIDTSHGHGTVALFTWGQDNTYFDDVVVYQPPPPNEIGPLQPGETEDFIVVVEIPGGSGGTTDTADITVSSVHDPAYTDVATITTESALPNPILTPTTSSMNGFPSWTLDHVLNIENGATGPDTFDLTVSGETWTTEIRDISGTTIINQIGPLAPGANQDFIVRVYLPAGPYGGSDVADVTASSQHWSIYTDISQVVSNIVPPNPILTPDTIEQNVEEATVYDYYLTLTNGAPLPDSFDLTTLSFPLFEQFEGTFPPPGWTVIDNEGTGVDWRRNDDWSEGNYIDNGGTYCACVDSDSAGIVQYDTELWSPTFSLATAATAWLEFDANYQNIGTDLFEVDVSTDGGGSWTNALSWSSSHGGFYSTPSEHVLIDLSGFALNSDVIVRWHYYNPGPFDWDWYAEIDNVMLTTTNLPSTILFQDFNGAWPPAGWTIIDGDAYGGWQQAAVDDHGNPSPDGTNAAYVRYEMGYNSDEWLVSPAFGTGVSTQLTYDWTWESDWGGSWSEGYVVGSTDGGATWPYLIYTFPNGAAWAQGNHVWDISAWADNQPNVAVAFHYVSISDDWYWMIDNVEVTSIVSLWYVELWNLAGTQQITQIGPLAGGASQDFRVRVTVPACSEGEIWQTFVMASSQTDGAFFDISQITTHSVNTLWMDDFEDGDISDWTEIPGTGDGGVAMYSPGQGCNSGVWSMYICGGNTEMYSPVTPLNAYSDVGAAYWIQRGSDAWSEDPDGGEDLIVEYLNDVAAWVQLDTFPGNGPVGEILNVVHQLPIDALHAGFQLRFRQTGGNGIGWDYWHIDDVQLIDGVVVESSYVPTMIIAPDDDPVNPNPTGGGGGSPTANPVEPLVEEEFIEPVIEEVVEEPVVDEVIEETVTEAKQDEGVQTVIQPEPTVTTDVQPTQDEITEPVSKKIGWYWALFPVFIVFMVLVPPSYRNRKKRE